MPRPPSRTSRFAVLLLGIRLLVPLASSAVPGTGQPLELTRGPVRTPGDREGLAEHAIHFWKRCHTRPQDVVVERNWTVNCDRGIGFGLSDPAWFRDLPSGDLRLTARARPALGTGAPIEDLADDAFRQPRPAATGRALGALEFTAPSVIAFSGFDWTVRSGEGGPGPNVWDPRNVRIDADGSLHLKIARRDGRWTCAEVTTRERFGFGRYEFRIEGPIDRLDDHVVLGLFNYPTRDVGEDATHEIDIEFARWGNPLSPIGNYTVWPVEKALKPTSKTYRFALTGTGSSHAFDWSPSSVRYRSWQGFGEDGAEIANWTFEPEEPERRVSRSPMPLHLNLWLFKGLPPKDDKEVEVIIRRVTRRTQ